MRMMSRHGRCTRNDEEDDDMNEAIKKRLQTVDVSQNTLMH